MGRQARERLIAEREAATRRRHRMWGVSIVLALLVVIGLVGYVIYELREPEPPEPPVARPVHISADKLGLVEGSGPVTVELYSDFLCPACRAFESDAADDLDRLLAQKRITLVYRPVAILDARSTNRYSTRSAAGAGCASDAGKLMAYAKVLFADQPAEGGPGFTDDQLVRLAATVGITGAEFERCLTGGRYTAWIGQVTDAMARNGVRGTPTVLVDGTQLAQPTGETLTAAVGQAG